MDNDQRAEWVTLAAGTITTYGLNTSGLAVTVATVTTADAQPRAVALGDVDGDQKADWLYSNGSSPILVYGSGTAHTFSDYGGLFAAPGDVDGDGRADILLADLTGMATLIGQPEGGTPTEFATIDGVGGAANAPYASGADLNSDGSADLVLIPSQAAAEAHGFDAPDFSSGFISPQMLPMGESTINQTGGTSQAGNTKPAPLTMGATILSAGADTRYVDDDQVCDGNTPCYPTIQAAVNASDGGGDTIIVYPGTYAAFNVPAGANYDYLTVQGVSADAVFVDGSINSAVDAISIAADGVHLANLTVRNATNGVNLKDGAGEATLAGGQETIIDHLLAYTWLTIRST